MTKLLPFSVVIPVFNEEQSIEQVLSDVVKVSSGLENKSTYEIVVVDDGSTDSTPNICRKFDTTYIRHDFNMGYGKSLKHGIRRAKYDNIVIIDGDSSYPAEEISHLLGSFFDGDVDMVVGTRIDYRDAQISTIRKLAKWLLTLLANYLSGTKIPDLNSGLRIMKKEPILRFLNILPDGFSFTTTITLAMLTNGYSVKFLPIIYKKRKGHSKIRPVRDTINFILLIIRTSLYFNPLKVFLPFSLFLIICSFFILIFSRLATGEMLDTTGGVVFMTGLIIGAIGLLADLIDKRLGQG